MQKDITKAVEVLKQGGVILYPTDTIWGLGCDAINEEAVERLYAIKQREKSKSMLILMDNSNKIQTYVNEVPDVAWDLIDLADKPLTVILGGAKNLATNLIGKDGTIGIRITSEDFSRELCRRFRKPIVSTSANIAGKPSPSSFNEIELGLLKLVDYVVEYRQDDLSHSNPSSIIKLGVDGSFELIRK